MRHTVWHDSVGGGLSAAQALLRPHLHEIMITVSLRLINSEMQ